MPIFTDNLANYADYLNGREYGANGWADAATVNRTSVADLRPIIPADSAAFLSDYNLDNPSLIVVRTFEGLGNPDDFNLWGDGITIQRGPPALIFLPFSDALANYNDAVAILIPQLGIRVTDSLANYNDSIAVAAAGKSIFLSADSLFAYAEQLTLRYSRNLALSDNLNAYVDQVARDVTAPTTFNHWITEELIGAHNGANTDFVTSQLAIVESMSVFHNGFRLVRVAGSPQSGEAQYGINGKNVKLGKAPAIGEWVQTRYFYDF